MHAGEGLSSLCGCLWGIILITLTEYCGQEILRHTERSRKAKPRMRVSVSAPSFLLWCGAALSSHCFDFPALKDCTPELWATTNPSPLSYYCQKEKKQRQRVAEWFRQWPLGVTGNAVHSGVCGISPKALCVWGRLIPKRPVKAYFWLPSLFKSPQQREIPDFEFSQLQVFWIGSTPGRIFLTRTRKSSELHSVRRASEDKLTKKISGE